MRYVARAAIGLAALLVSANASAQDTGCPAGTELSRVRLSKVKPGKTMADFKAAVADHVAWYISHGFKIKQDVAPVVTIDPATRTPKLSTDEVMTFATGDNVSRDKQDAGWAAFVAKYRDTSDLVVERAVCVPTKP